MASPYCLCDAIKPLVSSASGCLLQHLNEPRKFSNTGKLVSQLLPPFERRLWRRTSPYDWAEIAAERTPVLVFPSDDKQSLIEPRFDQYWIVLDATWQQARKMLRQSPSLATLPRVAVAPSYTSAYTLRRNQTEQGLCTLEVVAALVSEAGEPATAELLHCHLRRFIQAYRAQRQDDRIANV